MATYLRFYLVMYLACLKMVNSDTNLSQSKITRLKRVSQATLFVLAPKLVN